MAIIEHTNYNKPPPRQLSGRASPSSAGGRGFDPRSRDTKDVKNGTSSSHAWRLALKGKLASSLILSLQ